MEFNEKLQELRRSKGLTQEELAGRIYVSRTAVSKWESGRGYPSIDSLRTLSKFFGVTIDELLSGEELITIAEEDGRQKETRIRDRVFGLLGISCVMFFFLPLFRQTADGAVQAVSLLSLSHAAVYLKAAYYAAAFGAIASGVLMLALQNGRYPVWVKYRYGFSLTLDVLGLFVFIASLQPYAAVIMLIFMIIKVLMLVKRQ